MRPEFRIQRTSTAQAQTGGNPRCSRPPMASHPLEWDALAWTSARFVVSEQNRNNRASPVRQSSSAVAVAAYSGIHDDVEKENGESRAWHCQPRATQRDRFQNAGGTLTMAGPRSSGGASPSQHDLDHRSAQLNPNNDAYWQSRGEDERPSDWEDRIHPGEED